MVSDNTDSSDKIFNVENGLQQGTVTAPKLFSIYISDAIKYQEHTLAFADDIAIYAHGKKLNEIQQNLQQKFNNIQTYCKNWKLSINLSKCETILFRTPLSRAKKDINRNWRNVTIKGSDGTVIERKNTIKYLGINLDNFLYYNEHINIQLVKAKSMFQKLRRLLFSKHLNKEIKMLCYTTMIRPILTYGCPIWFNISPSDMERLRIFERNCLRKCLGKTRSMETDFKHLISNQKIYNEANINRIDIFIIKLIRDHYLRVTNTLALYVV